MTGELKYCPVCGVVLTKLDVEAHARRHFPAYLDPAKSSKEARKRQALLLKGGVTMAEYKALIGGK
jgi:hypothetical protein